MSLSAAVVQWTKHKTRKTEEVSSNLSSISFYFFFPIKSLFALITQEIGEHLRTVYNIGIKHVFPYINIRWVPREVFNIARVTQRMLMHGKIMFNRYYCIKVSKKSILEWYFDVLFWHYFVLIFLHRRTKIISIYILIPGPSVINYSIMAENWQEFTTWWQSLQNVVVVCHLF